MRRVGRHRPGFDRQRRRHRAGQRLDEPAGSLKTGTLPPTRLDWLASELNSVNLNSGAAATIFEALATADTKTTRPRLAEADRNADDLGLDDPLLDWIFMDLDLE